MPLPEGIYPFPLQRLLEASPDPAYVVDRDLRIVAFGGRFAGLAGRPREGIAGCSCFALSHGTDRPCEELGEACPARAVFETGRVSEAVHLHPSAGGTKAVSLRAAPVLDDSGQVAWALVVSRDVTQHLAEHDGLARDREMLQTLLEFAPVPVFLVDPAGRVLKTNPAAAEFLGATPDTFEDLRFGSFLAEGEGQDLVELFRRLVEEGEAHGEARYRRHDGRCRSILVDGKAAGAGRYIVVARDVSELDALVAQLRVSEERFRSLFHHSLSAVGVHEMLFDDTGRPADYRFLELNRAFGEQTGLPVAEALGRCVTEVIPGIRDTGLIEAYAEVVRSGTPLRTRRYVEPLRRHFDINAYRLGDTQFAVVFRDISDHVAAEDAERRELRRSKAVATLAHSLASARITIAELAADVLTAARGATGAPHGFVSTIDLKTGENVCHTLTAMMGDTCRVLGPGHRISFPRGEDGSYPGLWGVVLNTGAPLLCDAPAAHPASRGAPKGHIGLESYLAAPAKLGGEILGMIALANKDGGFDQDDLRTLESIAQLYALALKRLADEAALRSSEDRFRRLAENSPDMVWRTDGRGTVLYSNPRTEALLGITAAEAIGLRPRDYLSPESVARIRAASAELEPAAGGSVALDIELEYRHPGGQTVPAHVRMVFLYDATGKVTQVEGVSRNISGQRAEEERQQRLEAQLRQQQKLNAIGTLASGVAHEINNPINVVMNYAELILDEVEPGSSVADAAQQIREESERVGTIVHRLLSFSRQDEERMHRCGFDELLGDTLSLMLRMLQKQGIRVEQDIAPELPAVACRRRQIQQVIMNLLVNARDALDERYPRSHPDKRLVVRAGIHTDDEGRWVRCTIEDYGTGIRPEHQERIFEPFFTTRPRDRGMGMGLAVAHGIVEDHDGRLSCQSSWGEGSSFHLDLPPCENETPSWGATGE